MRYTIIPSIIAHSQAELDKRLKKISAIRPEVVQLDVMDGAFVRQTSLEFDFKLAKGRKYEAHLMLSNPLSWFMHNHSKISSVIFHYESDMHIHDFIKLARKYRKKVGIAINPSSDIEDIVQYLHLIDKVLIMTVYPGKYGSKFIPEVIGKIGHVRNLNDKIDIQVDGGINERKLLLCKQAGANEFVVGSYLQNAKNVKSAWAELKKALKGQMKYL